MCLAIFYHFTLQYFPLLQLHTVAFWPFTDQNSAVDLLLLIFSNLHFWNRLKMCFLKCRLVFRKEGKSFVGQKWLNKKGR